MSFNFEKIRPAIGVAVIVIRDRKILLGKRKGAHGVGTWGPPGGHLEFGETVEMCATRELAEETGIKPLSIKLGPWTENLMEDGKKHYVSLFVFVSVFENEPQALEPDKCEGWNWFEWDKLPTPLFPTVYSIIEKMTLKQLLDDY